MDAIRKCLYGYQSPIDQIAKQILQVTAQYRGLSCRLEPFVFNDGRSVDLACLEGTIPVSFRGVYYNIPISIHLMKTHPIHPPICFVKPTSDMSIKIGMYVDQSGKIYLPYLHEWHPSKSDLLGLIQVMVITFGDHPPVYSKPKSETQSPYPQQAYMPMPGVGVSNYGGYPLVGYNGVRGPTPYPAYPSQPTPYPPQTGYGHPQPAPTTQDSTSSSTSSNSSGTITEEHIRLSLVSAIEHKVKRRLEETTSQQRAELEILKQTGHELSQGKAKIQSLIDKLDKEKMELERNITILKEKDVELEKSISELKEENEIDVDEAVTTTAPLYKQIVNCYAEEAATEDAIYYMGEALRRGVIDVDVFLKQVRFLSRKQFMLRALMQKCRLKAGLGR